ncbi:MAG: PQQ-dependent sugar dehydrogenase, partial [Caulobacteraceae bacterium]|nr:PQQ-dependent sugar dehydrogenase [Caulobacter sp.]
TFWLGRRLIPLYFMQQRFEADLRFGLVRVRENAEGIALHDGWLYAEAGHDIVRYKLEPGKMAPDGKPQTIVTGLPTTGDHPMHPFLIDEKGDLFVDLGSATNACEKQNRVLHSKGNEPCTEKETRGGVWRFDADKQDQQFSPAERWASGLRNGEGFTQDSSGQVYVSQHGRDQLNEDWPNLYTAEQGHQLPSEEIVALKKGADFGWPECYFDPKQDKLVLAPEYGGDGGKKVGVCAQRTGPVAFFPAHWAPNDIKMYEGKNFPKAYDGGIFIAFHGSWNRAPGPQGGYNVVFQPFADGKLTGKWSVFADGFAGPHMEPSRAEFRPSGLAIGPKGALYVSDDGKGRIWRITYVGGNPDAPVEAAPAPVGKQAAMSPDALPPEGMHPNAGQAAAGLTPPPGATKQEVALGDKIFHGEIDKGTCGGCHGGDLSGTPIGADLMDGKFMWSDGSLKGIEHTIANGVPKPKDHPGAMPPMGGMQMSQADLKAVAAYVWAVSHPGGK